MPATTGIENWKLIAHDKWEVIEDHTSDTTSDIGQLVYQCSSEDSIINL